MKKRGGKESPRLINKPANQRQITCRNKDTEQVHLIVGAPGLKLGHDKIYIMQLITTILGGGLSSRLFQEIREKRGLVYSVYSYHSSYQDAGLFGMYAGLSKQNVDEVLELIFKQVRDIQVKGVPEEELHRAKEQLKGNLYLGLENVNARMSRLGKSQMYLGRVITPEEVIDKLNMVTTNDIQELAQEMLDPRVFPWPVSVHGMTVVILKK
ncbi:MAG: insulinase family protein [Candidatus Syntrophopropionicum ammoniitolerans]